MANQVRAPYNIVLDLSVARDHVQIVPPNVPIGGWKCTNLTPLAVVAIHTGVLSDGVPVNLSDGWIWPVAWLDGFYITNAAQAGGTTCTITFQPGGVS